MKNVLFDHGIIKNAGVQFLRSSRFKHRGAIRYGFQGHSHVVFPHLVSCRCAIKEALTNSIRHRDYYDTAANIMVELYDDRLESSNPGIPRMADLMQEAGLPAPEYQTEGFFTSVLYKNKNTIKDTGKKTGKKMPERILESIKKSPQITVLDIAKQCGFTYNGAYYHIEKMRKKGILTHKGDKGGEWVIL